MMKSARSVWVVVPGVLLIGLLVALWITRGSMEQLAFLRKGEAAEQGIVDQRPAKTAETLAGLAVSAEEQSYAQQAEKLAGHEVDQAFAQALRQATVQQRTLTGEAAETAARVTELKAIARDDQAKADALAAQWKQAGTEPSEGDDLDVARAQLQLDQDQLTDATADLARESGDQRAKIEQELQARQAAEKKGTGGARETAVVAVKRFGSLWGRGNAWFEQRNRAQLLDQARLEVEAEVKELGGQHDVQEQKSAAMAKAGAAPQFAAGRAKVKMLETLATRRVMMSILDDRVQTDQQLAQVYGKWETQVWLQHRIVRHLILRSLAGLMLIVLIAAVGIYAGSRAIEHWGTDERRQRTLKTILELGCELLGVVAALLVVFGVPEQMPTILGLAGAGLTVVFQDFILAFFGWFVLMGRNGMRPCDWVEIDSIGGEVLEIGLFRTVLLETGNWTSRGHPTGRRVTFTNSFAIRGQYFNFTTHGQWMWDEITVSLPATVDASEVVRQMQTAVDLQAAEDVDEAEAEWRSAARSNGKGNGLSEFSAKPSVSLRPASSGVDVLVRFVTRAAERFEVRKQLYDVIVGLIQAPARALEAGKKD